MVPKAETLPKDSTLPAYIQKIVTFLKTEEKFAELLNIFSLFTEMGHQNPGKAGPI
jgi:hypothetical protein